MLEKSFQKCVEKLLNQIANCFVLIWINKYYFIQYLEIAIIYLYK